MRYTEGRNASDPSTDKGFTNSECVICYIDRFAGEYVYYPFRKGRICSIKREQQRAYYEVELGAHCHSKSPTEFTETIQDKVPNSPRLTNEEPTYPKDGVYCVDGPEPADHVVTANDSWSRAVDQIYGTESFRTDVPAFFLLNITKEGAAPSFDAGRLVLRANQEYNLSIQYRRLRSHKAGAAGRRIELGMKNLVESSIKVGSVADRHDEPFTLPPLDYSAGAIIVQTVLEADGPNGQPQIYKARVPFRTSVWRIVLLLLLILAFVSGFEEFWKVHWDFGNTDAWFSTVMRVVGLGVIIFALFKFRGKLKLPG